MYERILVLEMNDLMLQLKRHGVTMDIYPNCPSTNGFKVRLRKLINIEKIQLR